VYPVGKVSATFRPSEVVADPVALLTVTNHCAVCPCVKVPVCDFVTESAGGGITSTWSLPLHFVEHLSMLPERLDPTVRGLPALLATLTSMVSAL
jgi:hypothetical protein